MKIYKHFLLKTTPFLSSENDNNLVSLTEHFCSSLSAGFPVNTGKKIENGCHFSDTEVSVGFMQATSPYP